MYAVKSQLRFHGISVDDGLIQLYPREGEDLISEEDILEVLEREGNRIAVVLLPGMQYYTGQKFNVEKLTETGHSKGCTMIWDMAHSAGNVHLDLHNWNVDAAVWCSYKYLNSGPGSIGAAFVHERHLDRLPAMNGWWGNRLDTKFFMRRDFDPAPLSADSYKLSSQSPSVVAQLLSSLEIYDNVGEEQRLIKQRLITGYLEMMVNKVIEDGADIRILTPSDPDQRGSMLSIKLNDSSSSLDLYAELARRGVVVDARKPGMVIRVTPIPLYNSYQDVWKFIQKLKEIL